MSDQATRDILAELFSQWCHQPCAEILSIGAQGSSRRYYRLSSAPIEGERRISAIGTVGDDLRENQAFFALARHLHAKGLPVPELYAVHPDGFCYLQQDLGDLSLYGLLRQKQQQGGGFDAEMLALYQQALTDLADIQTKGSDFDFYYAYPRPAFDRQSIVWDLNYFKYHFLKLAHIPFDEQLLEDDFHTLTDIILQADNNFLLYRDFQSRNIMVVQGSTRSTEECKTNAPSEVMSQHSLALPCTPLHSLLYYIDFQGARRGPSQYDVASLLYSAKSNLPEPIRRDLLGHYLDVRQLKGNSRKQWISHFWAILLLRILQTLGAYGYRGIFERKDYFLQSIPLAIANLQHLAEDHPDLFSQLPYLKQIVTSIHPPATQLAQCAGMGSLTVTVLSFSYKKGLPSDSSGNGGGFIFDCRALPNPGRYPEYQPYTGKDRPVIEFLEKEPAVEQFLDHVKALVAQSVEKYLERNFTSLQVAFGCTGGQHRSVYCAERLARWLSETYPCQIKKSHREQD